MNHSLRENLHYWWKLLRKLPTIPNRIRSELANLRMLQNETSRLSRVAEETWLQVSSSDEALSHSAKNHLQVTKQLEQVAAQLQEHALILETAIRAPQQAQAESQLLSKLTVQGARSPGLSVLIPCWNHGGLLKQSIESAVEVISELECPGEIIVLDDASRDESRSIARACAGVDSRVRLIESGRNLGLARGRNTLLGQSKYHHALMLDADNRLLSKGVNALYHSACQTKATLTYGTIVMVDEGEHVVGLMSHRHVTPEAYRQNWVDAMAIVRTERLIDLGGYESDILGAICDWELLLRLMRLQEPIVHVPTPVGIYRRSPLSMLHDAVDHLRIRRLRRMYAIDGPPRAEDIRAAVHHPTLGYLRRRDATIAEARPITRSASNTNRPRFLVISSGGVRNHGDDAILLATLQRLERIRPDAETIVVSDGSDTPPLGRQAWWAGTCQEICKSLEPEAIQHGCKGYPQLAVELPNDVGASTSAASCPIDFPSIDAVIFSGGGNLATYWPQIVAWRAALAATARSMNIPYIFTGQGVGPFDEAILTHVKFLAETSENFVTRDPLSGELLKTVCAPSTRIETCGDDALGIDCEESSALRQWLSEIGIPDRLPLLGFHVRLANYTGFDHNTQIRLAKQVDELAALLGYSVLCLPINSQPAAPEVELLTSLRAACQSNATWYVADASDQPHRVAGLVKLCASVVSQSFHVALHALESAIPTLMLAGTEYYQRKGRGLERSFGTPCPITIPPDCNAATMRDRIIRLRSETWKSKPTPEAIDNLLDQALPHGLKSQPTEAPQPISA